MTTQNYNHNVIRLRKGKPSVAQVYWIIVISNKSKTSSQKVKEQLGFFRHGRSGLFVINTERLAYYLNKGYILKMSVKRFLNKMALSQQQSVRFGIKQIMKKLKKVMNKGSQHEWYNSVLWKRHVLYMFLLLQYLNLFKKVYDGW